MSQLKFTMKPTEEKRNKGYMKKSRYDPIIDAFIEKGKELVEVTIEGRRVPSAVITLRKRIETRGLDIFVSSVGGAIYLEKNKGDDPKG